MADMRRRTLPGFHHRRILRLADAPGGCPPRVAGAAACSPLEDVAVPHDGILTNRAPSWGPIFFAETRTVCGIADTRRLRTLFLTKMSPDWRVNSASTTIL